MGEFMMCFSRKGRLRDHAPETQRGLNLSSADHGSSLRLLNDPSHTRDLTH